MRQFLKRVSWYIFISIFCTKIDTQMIKDEKNEMQVVTIMYNKFKIPKHVLLYLWDLTQNMSLMFLQHVSFLLYFAPCTPTAVFVHPWDMADWSQFPLKQRSFDTVDNKGLRLSFFTSPLLENRYNSHNWLDVVFEKMFRFFTIISDFLQLKMT